jgi:SAM-dependent methyltransferase
MRYMLHYVGWRGDDRTVRSNQGTYTHGHAESVLRSHLSRTVDNSAAYVAERFRPGASVLDVGCGPGSITVDIAARVAPGRVLGIDSSAEVIDGARALAGRARAGNATFAVGDVYALDAADDSFDVVHAHQVLQHLVDPVAALREMLRVCRPDGVVAARDADYAGMTWYPADPRLDRWLEICRAVFRRNGAEPATSWRGRTRRVLRTSCPVRLCGATPRPSSGTGGVGCGPTASSSRRSLSRPWTAGSAAPRSSWRSRQRGGNGRLIPTAGSRSSTVRCSAVHDRSDIEDREQGQRPHHRGGVRLHDHLSSADPVRVHGSEQIPIDEPPAGHPDHTTIGDQPTTPKSPAQAAVIDWDARP